MRKLTPLILLISILLVGIMAQGIAFGQDATPTPPSTLPPTDTATITPTSTLPPTDIPTTTPTSTVTETATFIPSPTLSETPVVLPTETTTVTPNPTNEETLTALPSESATVTETGTVTETPIATTSPTATATAIPEMETPTFVPTLTMTPTLVPTGLTRMFFFQGLSGANVDIYGNGIQLGDNVETGRMLGRFILLDGTATTLLVYPAGSLEQPILINTLAFEPGSTVLVVAFDGPNGVPTLAVYRLDTATGQSQFIAINASDASNLSVVTSGVPASSLGQGTSAQMTVAPGNTAGLVAATGDMSAQEASPQEAFVPGVVYLQVAVGSVTNGTYRIITQAIDVNSLKAPTP